MYVLGGMCTTYTDFANCVLLLFYVLCNHNVYVCMYVCMVYGAMYSMDGASNNILNFIYLFYFFGKAHGEL